MRSARAASAVAFITGWICTSAGAVEIAGAWQGTGEVPEFNLKSRAVLRITEASGAYQATLDVLDRGVKGLPMKLTYKHPKVTARLSLPARTIVVEGILNAEGTQLISTYREEEPGEPVRIDVPVILKRTATPDSLPEPMSDSDFAPRPDSDLQGCWTTTIVHGNTSLPTCIKIAESSVGSYRAEFESPCEGLRNIPATVTYRRPRVDIEVPGFGISIAGMMDGGGRSFSATASRGGGRDEGLRLVYKRVEGAAPAAKRPEQEFNYSAPSDLQGHWKGVLAGARPSSGAKLPLAVSVAKTQDSGYLGSLNNPSELQTDVATTRVVYSPPYVRLDWRGVGFWFEGKLKDGRIAGKWHEFEGREMPRDTAYPIEFERIAIQ